MNFLLWIILIFFALTFALRLFLRYGMPWLLNRLMKKQQEKFNQAFKQEQGFNSRKKEGEVEINVPPKQKNNNDNEFGEYIEFEEDIEDKPKEHNNL